MCRGKELYCNKKNNHESGMEKEKKSKENESDTMKQKWTEEMTGRPECTSTSFTDH